MELRFKAEDHIYESVDGSDIKWKSATGVLNLFKKPFDQEKIALGSSKKKKSKWYGMKPEDIIAVWDKETLRATTMGSWYHDQREKELIACDTVQRNGIDLPIYRPVEQDGIKLSPSQKLTSGIYPEHMVYLKSAKLCGQADRVEVVGDTVNVYDYKTNKEIKTKPYVSWDGTVDKLKAPLNHIDDCSLMHYALQLSIYMYIILKHNHNLKPGKLEIHHIVFEIEDTDEYGYPIVATDPAGDPIVKEVVPYDLPYLKKEVNSIIKYLKTEND